MSVITFKGLRDEVSRILDEANTPAAEGTTTKVLIKDFINQAHQQRCGEFPWNFMLWPQEVTFTTILDEHVYILHPEFHRPLYFLNKTTGDYLQEVPFRAIPQTGNRWTGITEDFGHAQHFYFWYPGPTIRQPAVPTTLTFVSSSPLDNSSTYDVVVKGEVVGPSGGLGYVTAEKVTPNGTTPVVTVNTYRTILGITKAGAWNGTMTVTDTTDGTVLYSLLDCELGRPYKGIFINENPTSTGLDEIEYRFYRQPMQLVNDYDVPDLPFPHTQLLVYDALVQMSAYLTESNPQTLGIWRQKQMEAQLSLYQAYATEGQTLEATPTYVRYLGDSGRGIRTQWAW